MRNQVEPLFENKDFLPVIGLRYNFLRAPSEVPVGREERLSIKDTFLMTLYLTYQSATTISLPILGGLAFKLSSG